MSGLGFGIPAAIGLVYFAEHRTVWTFLGVPHLRRGPIRELGPADEYPSPRRIPGCLRGRDSCRIHALDLKGWRPVGGIGHPADRVLLLDWIRPAVRSGPWSCTHGARADRDGSLTPKHLATCEVLLGVTPVERPWGGARRDREEQRDCGPASIALTRVFSGADGI